MQACIRVYVTARHRKAGMLPGRTPPCVVVREDDWLELEVLLLSVSRCALRLWFANRSSSTVRCHHSEGLLVLPGEKWRGEPFPSGVAKGESMVSVLKKRHADCLMNRYWRSVVLFHIPRHNPAAKAFTPWVLMVGVR